ncbi:MAG: RNA 2',3'-cyclic phosphodiesterase [Spirochaetales bacterium]|nr:RNA 2',3'-cyclic phosphodiesterase [Spirochaetales bacterium]
MRIFLASWLPEELAAELAVLSFDLPGARPIPASNFHVTIRFLGDCMPAVQDDVEAIMQSIEFTPFAVDIAGVGQFEQGKNRVVWARVESEGLLRLEAKIKRELEKMGIRVERRRFRPHITIGRIASPDELRLQQFFQDYYDFSGSFECSSFGLYASRLHPDGPRYREIAVFPAGEGSNER